MAKQNIFDNEVFYEGYKGIRNQKVNANNLFEIPALFSLLPKMEGKKVLDLGCGYGEHCKMFVESGAEWVTGIDISEKMLDVARKENSDTHIEYINMPMEDIDSLVKDEKKYDLVVSSLAFHYVEDYEGVVKKIIEPFPTEDILKEHPQYKDLFHKPDFILIKAVKPGSRCDWFMEECI